MRRLTTTPTILAILAILLHAGSALARTAAPVCRSACAPRVAEQCDGLAGGTLRRCRRPLLRACRRSTPLIACESSADLTAALAEHVVRAGTESPPSVAVALCASGRFTTSVSPPASDPDEVTGAWSIRVANGGLVLELSTDGHVLRQVPWTRDAAGTPRLDGLPVALSDGGAACFVPAPAPPATPEALVAIARAVSDRTLHTARLVVGDAAASRQRSLTLCADGTFTSSATTGADTSDTRGRWTVVPASGGAALDLAPDTGDPEQLAIAVEPRVVLDALVATVVDARAACTPPVAPPPPADPFAPFTEGLRDRSYFFVTQVGTIPVRTKLGLCGTGRYVLATTLQRRGAWNVEIVDGATALVLHDDAGAVVRAFKLALDADGAVLLDGTTRPNDDPAVIDAACQ